MADEPDSSALELEDQVLYSLDFTRWSNPSYELRIEECKIFLSCLNSSIMADDSGILFLLLPQHSTTSSKSMCQEDFTWLGEFDIQNVSHLISSHFNLFLLLTTTMTALITWPYFSSEYPRIASKPYPKASVF